jgi:hypothetical protein
MASFIQTGKPFVVLFVTAGGAQHRLKSKAVRYEALSDFRFYGTI